MMGKEFLRKPLSSVNYVRTREINLHERRNLNEECSRHMLANGTYLSTIGKHWSQIAIYKYRSLTLNPFCRGNNTHECKIINTCWLDDEVLISVGGNKVAVWHINEDIEETVLAEMPTSINPIRTAEIDMCATDNGIDAITFNKACMEIATLTTFNHNLSIWSLETFQCKGDIDLPLSYDFAPFDCYWLPRIAVHENGTYAIGCHDIWFFDQRASNSIKKISDSHVTEVISLSYQGNLLTVGTVEMIKFYDVRADKYLVSSEDCNVVGLKVPVGGNRCFYPVVHTHSYSPSGTKLFMGGGTYQLRYYNHHNIGRNNYNTLWER